MTEKLVENWLDSASERSYQPVFVQILSGQGFSVVHSTRHAALEFGKDVLAIDSDGAGCAYQLKGHPGGRMGLSQFRQEILPQLVQLISQPVVFPGFPEAPAKSFLVTNGYFDEEVQRSVDDLNRGHYPSKVSLISRGDLLKWAKELGVQLWPSELSDSRTLLELFLSNSKEPLETAKLSTLVANTLSFPANQSKIGRNEFERKATSAAVLTGIATSGLAETSNHFAVACAWTILAVSVIAEAEEHLFPISGPIKQTVELAEAAAFDALVQLWKEVKDRSDLIEGNPFTDPEVYSWRYLTILGALTCLALFDDSHSVLEEDDKRQLRAWLLRVHRVDIWGEGALANLVPWLVWVRKNDATLRPDVEIANTVAQVVNGNQLRCKSPLASPYYNFETIARRETGLEQPFARRSIARETFAGSAFCAELLLHLLVRTNLKQTCKRIWPNFSRLSHRACIPDNAWQYGVYRFKEGTDQTRLYPRTYDWAQLKREALNSEELRIPEALKQRPGLLAMWWQVAPHRCSTDATHALVDAVLPGWGS